MSWNVYTVIAEGIVRRVRKNIQLVSSSVKPYKGKTNYSIDINECSANIFIGLPVNLDIVKLGIVDSKTIKFKVDSRNIWVYDDKGRLVDISSFNIRILGWKFILSNVFYEVRVYAGAFVEGSILLKKYSGKYSYYIKDINMVLRFWGC